MRALGEPAVFSNVVSVHLSVPDGMDQPRHTEYRRIIEPYFSLDQMTAPEPRCRGIARDAAASLPDAGEVDVMADLADEFALRAQRAFLNWPVELHRRYGNGFAGNHAATDQAATRSRDRKAMAAVAFEFDQHIRGVIDQRRLPGSTTQIELGPMMYFLRSRECETCDSVAAALRLNGEE